MRSMSLLYAFVFVPALAGSATASEACDTLAAKLATRSGASIIRKGPTSGNVFLRHAGAREWVVLCGPGPMMSVGISAEEGLDKLLVLATLSALTLDESAGPQTLKKIAACIKSARRAKVGDASETSGGLEFSCSPSGAGVYVAIQKR